MKKTSSNPTLKALFSSETRIKILSHFFLHTDESFYIRQLENLLELPVGQLSRDLVNLEAINLLTSHHEGNQKRYTLNREHPIYSELRSIFLKTAGLGDILKKALAKHKGIELAFLYGSFAKGEEHAGSDVDIMIIGNTPEKDLNRSIGQAENKLRKTVNYSIYERKEVEERLKKKDDFITTVFTDPHILLIGNETDELFQTVEGQ
jgi:predicted nucleotidyltransferase